MSRNRQVLLGMPDTNAQHNKINIDSLGAEDARGSKSCANMFIAQETEPKQETDSAEKCYTNIYSISKSTDNSTKPTVKHNLIKQ